MKKILIALFLIGLFLIPASASAQSPVADLQPWMFAAIQSSGLGTAQNVQIAFTNYQNRYAREHNFTTEAQWRTSYWEVVTKFMTDHGCASCRIDDTGASLPVRIYTELYLQDFDILPVVFQKVK